MWANECPRSGTLMSEGSAAGLASDGPVVHACAAALGEAASGPAAHTGAEAHLPVDGGVFLGRGGIRLRSCVHGSKAVPAPPAATGYESPICVPYGMSC